MGNPYRFNGDDLVVAALGDFAALRDLGRRVGDTPRPWDRLLVKSYRGRLASTMLLWRKFRDLLPPEVDDVSE